MTKESKTDSVIIIRDRFKTYHDKLSKIVERFKIFNPDKLTRDQLENTSKSQIIRRAIDELEKKSERWSK